MVWQQASLHAGLRADGTSAELMAALGYLYAEMDAERGGPRADARAVKWWRKAAELGQLEAQAELAAAYFNGRGGLERSQQKAIMWWQRSANQGQAHAQYSVGTAFLHGQGGLERSEARALEWWRKAAAQEHADAQLNLGLAMAKAGDPQSVRGAVGWWRKAAAQGHAAAQFWLGTCFYSGRGGLEPSEATAVEWWRKAASQGHTDAKDRLNRVLGADGMAAAEAAAEAARAARGTAQHEGMSAAELDADIWHAPGVTRSELRAGAALYELAGLRVAVLDGAAWAPHALCERWDKAMRASPGLPINSERCAYDGAGGEEEMAAGMFPAFAREYGDVLRQGFGVGACEWDRWPYVTRLSREFAPDHLHSDECRARPEVTVTILAYPHETWPPAWRGHTEFAPLDCASDAGRAVVRNQTLNERTAPALRVAPAPGRTVVFDGRLLHRASLPSTGAGAPRADAPRGVRYSTVLRMVCKDL